MPSAGLEPATPALGRRRSGPLSYEGMLLAARQREVIIDIRRSGRSSARLECTVRDREVGGSNPLAPTPFLNRDIALRPRERARDGSAARRRLGPPIDPAEGARSGATLPTGCEVRPPGRGVPTWKAPSPNTTFDALRAALHPDHLSTRRALITRGSAAQCHRGWRGHRPRESRPRDAPQAARFPRP